MANIFVDPVIVMAPPNDASREVIEAWIANLEIWLKEALTSPFAWLHALEATYILESIGLFPNFELLRRLQRRHSLNVSITQIARNINDFFRNEEFNLSSNLDKLEYLIEIEDGSISIKPDQFPARWLDSMQATMYELFAKVCAGKCAEYEFVRALHVATRAMYGIAKEIEVSATLIDSVPDIPRNVDDSIMQTFPLLYTPDDLLPLIDVIELWEKGVNGLVYAIEQQYKKDWQGATAAPMKFHIGYGFLESVHTANLETNENTLRRIIKAAAAVIADQAKHSKGYKLHELRETEAGGSPQRTRVRDNAKAWRLMIGQRGAGWRLHYWQIPAQEGSLIEFSNIVKESDDTIFE